MKVYVVFSDDGDTLAVLSELDLANGYMWQYKDCGGQCYMEEHVVDGVEVNAPGCYHDGTALEDR
jgi:hypothetical protein